MLKLIHPEEKHTTKEFRDGILDNKDALPKSLLSSSLIRKLVYANTIEAEQIAKKVNWDAYKCNVRGVRWVAVDNSLPEEHEITGGIHLVAGTSNSTGVITRKTSL